ncbi:MAG TPA: HlyD family efflux transporter periplasmic adaptor subunit [Opitutaceae bacterium]
MFAQRSPFRQAALDRLSSPEQLDDLREVAPSRAWIALASLGVLLAAVLGWSIFGRIPTKLHGDGILLRGQQIGKISALEAGLVTRVRVAAGDVVTRGQVVAEVRRTSAREGDAALQLVTQQPGRVLELLAKPGDVVAAGQSLLSLESTEGDVEAILYLDAAQGRRIAVGMPVQVAPLPYPKSEYGYLVGQVKSVSDFPASRAAMQTVIEHEDLVRRLASGGAPIAVRVSLSPAPGASGRYLWSSSAGPASELRSGTLCAASIVIDERRPIALAIPALDRRR